MIGRLGNEKSRYGGGLVGRVCFASHAKRLRSKHDQRGISVSHGHRLSVPVSCQTQADLLLQTLQRYPHPANWHWILLCDDAAWNHLLVHIDRSRDSVYAVTDLEGRTTCVRGTTLLRPDQPQASPEHVVAHELAHIMLRTPDEDRAEQLARHWLRECHRVGGENGNCLAPIRTGL
jgi:hypothetical protein